MMKDAIIYVIVFLALQVGVTNGVCFVWQKVADSTHSAVDYLIKTDARSEIIERHVLTLYNLGIRTKDFKRLVTERGLK